MTTPSWMAPPWQYKVNDFFSSKVLGEWEEELLKMPKKDEVVEILKVISNGQKNPNHALSRHDMGRLIQGLLRMAEEMK